jgi:glycosyltransferase involved in cell wall biosynthesis
MPSRATQDSDVLTVRAAAEDGESACLDKGGSRQAASTEQGVCMVGAFPPPVHGLAMMNAGIHKLLCERGASPMKFNLSPATLSRGWFNRLARISKVGKGLWRYVGEIVRGRGATLYVGVSGGWGQLYEALFVVLGRLRGARIFLHHHSFAYLEEAKLPAALLMRVAGRRATHIVLCERQARLLRERYPAVSTTTVVSNASVMSQNVTAETRQRTSPRHIGFLGNISVEKGIVELLSIAERLEAQAAGFEVYIAGPFENSEAKQLVQDATARLRSVTYLGPRYGIEKEEFWGLIDVLVFPSKYVNEAAPLVVYEAMAHGVPVIAWERGCLAEMVTRQSGLLIPRKQDFVTVAVEQVLQWQREPEMFSDLSAAAARNFLLHSSTLNDKLSSLLAELCAS